MTSIPVLKMYPLADRLGCCEALGEFIDEDVFGVGRRLEQPGSGERMLLVVVGRAQTTYGAIATLAREPDGDSAAMLSRAIFEGMVDAYWIAKYPLAAQDLAAKSLRLLRTVMAEQNNTTRLPGDPMLPLAVTNPAERKALARMFGTKARNHWTNLKLPDRIAQVMEDVPQDSDGELQRRYDEDNVLANLLLHGSPMAINDRITQEGYVVTVQIGPTEQHLAPALRHAYWSYYRMGLLLLVRRRPEAQDAFEATYRTGWPRLQTITDGALKAAGRNGLCPCHSGLKVKQCHGAL